MKVDAKARGIHIRISRGRNTRLDTKEETVADEQKRRRGERVRVRSKRRSRDIEPFLLKLFQRFPHIFLRKIFWLIFS